MNAGVRVIRPPWGRSAHVRAESRWVRFSVRMSTVVLVALGLAMLAVGIWVEDRAAVAAPLVIIGALAVVARGDLRRVADIEQMPLGQSGFSVTRCPPAAEQLTEAGLSPEVAQEMQEWMDALIDAVPGLVDKRVSR